MGERDGERQLAPDDDPLAPKSSAAGLELDLSGAAPSRSSDAFLGGGGRMLDDGLDGLGAPTDLPTLELDEPAPDRTFPRPQEPRQAPSSPRSEPGESGDSPTAALDPGAVDALADYGPPPSNPVGVVPYAILVFLRRRALQKSLADLRRLKQTAETDHAEALVSLGRALHARPDADALRPLADALRAADETGRVAGERTQEWERSRHAADAQRASLTEKIAQAESAAGPYRDRETKLATQMNVRETDLRRAKAKLQRIEIELRNPATEPDRRALLEAERDARKADVDQAKGKVDELAPQLSDARRELTVMQQALNDLETQRRAVDQAQTRSEKVHLTTAGEAETHYHAAVRHLAEQAILRNAAPAIAPTEASKAQTMRATLESREREVRLHEAALRAYDPKAFQRGVAVLGGAALLLVAMLLFALIR